MYKTLGLCCICVVFANSFIMIVVPFSFYSQHSMMCVTMSHSEQGGSLAVSDLVLLLLCMGMLTLEAISLKMYFLSLYPFPFQQAGWRVHERILILLLQ